MSAALYYKATRFIYYMRKLDRLIQITIKIARFHRIAILYCVFPIVIDNIIAICLWYVLVKTSTKLMKKSRIFYQLLGIYENK